MPSSRTGALPGYDSRMVPLHRYVVLAMDIVYNHLKSGAAIPASQVVRTVPRGGTPGAAPAITAANVPPIAATPSAADAITFSNNTLTIPKNPKGTDPHFLWIRLSTENEGPSLFFWLPDGHQAGVAAGCRGVDAHHALDQQAFEGHRLLAGVEAVHRRERAVALRDLPPAPRGSASAVPWWSTASKRISMAATSAATVSIARAASGGNRRITRVVRSEAGSAARDPTDNTAASCIKQVVVLVRDAQDARARQR